MENKINFVESFMKMLYLNEVEGFHFKIEKDEKINNFNEPLYINGYPNLLLKPVFTFVDGKLIADFVKTEFDGIVKKVCFSFSVELKEIKKFVENQYKKGFFYVSI